MKQLSGRVVPFLIALIVLAWGQTAYPFTLAPEPAAPMPAGIVVDRIVAKVNEEIILLSDLRDKMVEQKRLLGNREITERMALEMMIAEKLQLQAAKKLDIKITDQEIDKTIAGVRANNNMSEAEFEAMLKREGLGMQRYREMVREQMTVAQVVNMEVRTEVRIGEEEIAAYYDRNRGEFMANEMVRARHIVLLAPSGAKPEYDEAAQREIVEIRGKLLAGADFAETARKYSQDGAAQAGGDLGWFKRGEMMKNFETAAFALKPGDISEVIRTSAGYHIILVEERKTGKSITFADAKQEIETRLYDIRIRDKFTEWMKKLQSNAFIEITL